MVARRSVTDELKETESVQAAGTGGGRGEKREKSKREGVKS